MPSRPKKVDSKGVRVSALLLPLIVATCLGCVAAEAGDEGPSGAVASRPAGPSAVYGGSAPTAPLPEEVAAALEEVGRLSAAGDLHAAAVTAEAWLARPLSVSDRRRFEALRSDVRRRMLQTLVLDGFVRAEPARLTVGGAVTLEVLLVNLSGRDLRIPSEAPGASPTTLHLKLECVEIAADGSRGDDRRTDVVALGEDVVLAPGERKAFRIPMGTDDRNPASLALRRFTVSATLWPARLEVGGESFPGSVLLKPAIIDAFPRNWEHLSAAPVERLAEALRKRSAIHIPLAAALVEPSDRSRAFDLLKAHLLEQGSSGPPFSSRVAACVALRLVTGKDLPADPAVWLKALEEGTVP